MSMIGVWGLEKGKVCKGRCVWLDVWYGLVWMEMGWRRDGEGKGWSRDKEEKK